MLLMECVVSSMEFQEGAGIVGLARGGMRQGHRINPAAVWQANEMETATFAAGCFWGPEVGPRFPVPDFTSQRPYSRGRTEAMFILCFSSPRL